MTEPDWNTCTDPEAMLAFLGANSLLSERKARLFAVACCRRMWPVLTDERGRRAVEVAERYADRVASQADVAGAARGAWDAGLDSDPNTNDDMRSLACLHAGATDARRAARETAFYASRAAVGRGEVDDPSGDELVGQAALLRDLFGPLPFRPVAIPASVLAWNAGRVVKLATTIYDERALPGGTLDNDRLAVLADALEEAGLVDQDVVRHLRQQGGVHVRSCWCVDLLLRRG
jgi:hypothetical protein